MENYYIYIYFDPTKDLEPFYVGKGKGNRSSSHLTREDHHPFTYRLRKLASRGVEPIIERFENLDEESAYELERSLVGEIGRKDLGKGPLLNLTDGGRSGGYVLSKKQIEARRKAAKAKAKAEAEKIKAGRAAVLAGKKERAKAQKAAEVSKERKKRGYRF